MLLYAQVDDFISTRPSAEVRMMDILRGIASRNRLQVYRVLRAMAECHRIDIRPHPKRRGGFATYRLKVCHWNGDDSAQIGDDSRASW